MNLVLAGLKKMRVFSMWNCWYRSTAIEGVTESRRLEDNILMASLIMCSRNGSLKHKHYVRELCGQPAYKYATLSVMNLAKSYKQLTLVYSVKYTNYLFFVTKLFDNPADIQQRCFAITPCSLQCNTCHQLMKLLLGFV